MGDVTKDFSREEFECSCASCHADGILLATKIEVIEALQGVRDILGEPVVVTRGVSCKAHNAAVGGASDSRHLPQHADAVDIKCSDSSHAFRIVGAAIKGDKFRVFRVYPHHVHLDMRPTPTKLFLASPDPQGAC